MYKKWSILTMIISGLLLFLISAFVIVVDPLFNYHKPVSKYGYIIDNEIYQNPGIAENFEYNCMLLGSSMVQNSKVSEIDDLFGVRTVKLSYSGASLYNIKVISDIAFMNRDIEKVFWGLDTVRMNADPNEPRFPLPNYLYNQNIFDDTQYVLNKSIVIQSIKTLKRREELIKNTSFDSAYAWYPALKDKFIADKVARSYLETRKGICLVQEEESLNYLINIDQNILPIIEEHPDTEFMIFFPPYSIMYWDTLNLQGVLEKRIDNKRYLISKLIGYENVRIYDFQAEELIICDINNYKDYSHFSPGINSFIIKSMAQNKYLITEENFEEELGKLYSLVVGTDVPALLNNYIEDDGF